MADTLEPETRLLDDRDHTDLAPGPHSSRHMAWPAGGKHGPRCTTDSRKRKTLWGVHSWRKTECGSWKMEREENTAGKDPVCGRTRWPRKDRLVGKRVGADRLSA